MGGSKNNCIEGLGAIAVSTWQQWVWIWIALKNLICQEVSLTMAGELKLSDL